MKPSTRHTQLWQVDKNNPDAEIIRQAGHVLRRGGLVAFPTETVYGLGANALDTEAVKGIFAAKGRPRDNPLIVHIAEIDTVFQYAGFINDSAKRLMETFWPGPLTLVLPARGNVSEEVSAGLESLAFRIPDHPVALALIHEAGVPVAAPSANLSGRPSPTLASHVYTDLNGRIDAILDGGPTGVGLESTVLDMTGDIPVILRPGGVTPEEIQAVAGKVLLDPSLGENGVTPERPASPGMKYRHYAPSAPLLLIEGDPLKVTQKIKDLIEEYSLQGLRVGVLCRNGNEGQFRGSVIVTAGMPRNHSSVAAVLYDALRSFENTGVDIILAEGVEPRGLGLAVANRLRRAAGGRIIKV